MQDIIQKIQSLGFSQYEAKAYVSLVRQGPTSAYQVSKESGIPRARIYEILNGLEEEGIVIKEEINDSVQYSPLPVDVFLESVQSKWNHTYQSISDTLKHFEKTEPMSDNRVMTLKGERHILAFCRTLLQRAEKKVVVSLWDKMYGRLEQELKDKATNCKLKGIVFQVENPLLGLDIHRKTSYVDNIGENKWFILSIDGREMIYGPSIEEREIAFYTDDPVHIYLLENYIWHDILVNRLVKRGKEDTDNWISKERDKFFGSN
ncbi:TrmB family transcriptional regulator [Bacillus sp. Xin]|uniref:TrmB family transcriptional regulator n=1 Tax=unclassified Bacillus (in: firmicutes) TaxID=185979 RepID=UPI001572AC10|nr:MULTISPECIES: TrmB family transcriptional regulator [unclassified Bacillus (in: firmicutes)]MBC6975068.1 TrmB family transcriptional regulator [Bacillus sp. Xin]NSW39469.1 TrmB family transcriptional regulator [Bacillus sp. Xin1]